ncbi:hypothetical protein ACU8KH_02866 [Lachancea thermotolerans]
MTGWTPRGPSFERKGLATALQEEHSCLLMRCRYNFLEQSIFFEITKNKCHFLESNQGLIGHNDVY